jgi:hypothetical protein
MTCLALNKKSLILGSDQLYHLLKSEYHLVQAKLIASLKGRHSALMTDAWTSISEVGYVTCNAHFIDNYTWKLHNVLLGLCKKTWQSRAVDFVDYAEQQLQTYDLLCTNMTAIVTYTKEMMISAGSLFV